MAHEPSLACRFYTIQHNCRIFTDRKYTVSEPPNCLKRIDFRRYGPVILAGRWGPLADMRTGTSVAESLSAQAALACSLQPRA